MPGFFATPGTRWAFEDWIAMLERQHKDRSYGLDEGRTYLRIWWRGKGSDRSRNVVGFLAPNGDLYRADSWKKKGRLLTNLVKRHPEFLSARDRARRAKHRCSGRDPFDKPALMKQIDREQKAAARRKLADLRHRIKVAVKARREGKPGAAEYCQRQRVEARERIEKLRADLRVLAVEIRRGARTACVQNRQAPTVEIEHFRRELAEEKRFLASMRRIEAGARARRPTLAKARVRQGESDDEVRQNIPEDLIPLFERVKRSIKASPRRSRTEAFLQYVEEHPREQFAAVDDATDALIADLERQQRAGRRDVARRRARRRIAARRRRR